MTAGMHQADFRVSLANIDGRHWPSFICAALLAGREAGQ